MEEAPSPPRLRVIWLCNESETRKAIMKILKVFVSSGGEIGIVDAIEYQGGIWLVPEWLDHPDKPMTQPARIIRMDVLPHTQMTGQADYALRGPIPKAVLDGETTSAAGTQFDVVERPDISIRTDIH